MQQQLLGGKVAWLVEKDVSRLRRLLDVGRQPVEVFNCGRVNFIDYVVVEDQPESVRLHNWDIVASEKENSWYTKVMGRLKRNTS